jgi:hypothetical protein
MRNQNSQYAFTVGLRHLAQPSLDAALIHGFRAILWQPHFDFAHFAPFDLQQLHFW